MKHLAPFTCRMCKQLQPPDSFRTYTFNGSMRYRRTCRHCEDASYDAPKIQATEKPCCDCQVVQPLEQFANQRNKNGRIYRGSVCKACRNRRCKEWAATANGKIKIHTHKLKKYGMDAESYDALLASQGGVCAICGKTEFIPRFKNGTIQRLSVDHSHNDGKVRGLLCNRCNRCIGLLGDDLVIVQACLSYLQKSLSG